MSRNIFLVAVGSLIGGVCRYLTALFFTRAYPSAFPYGTFVVNIAGCFAIGIIYGMATRFEWFSPDLRLFLATGFCGGFTTFSSFAYENLQLIQDKDLGTFFMYSAASFVFGLLAAWGGVSLARL